MSKYLGSSLEREFKKFFGGSKNLKNILESPKKFNFLTKNWRLGELISLNVYS